MPHSWIHLTETSEHHILCPVPATTAPEDFLDAQKALILPTITPLPHDTDVDLQALLRDLFKSPLLRDSRKISAEESLVDYAHRFLANDLTDNLVTITSTLPGAVRQTLLRLPLLLLLTCNDLIGSAALLTDRIHSLIEQKQSINTTARTLASELKGRPTSESLESERQKRQRIEEDLSRQSTHWDEKGLELARLTTDLARVSEENKTLQARLDLAAEEKLTFLKLSQELKNELTQTKADLAQNIKARTTLGNDLARVSQLYRNTNTHLSQVIEERDRAQQEGDSARFELSATQAQLVKTHDECSAFEAAVRNVLRQEKETPDTNKSALPSQLATLLANLRLQLAMATHMSVDARATAGTIQAIWNALPADIRGTAPVPPTAQELQHFLNTIHVSATPLAAGACHHPAELSQVLFSDDDTEWNDSLDEVRRLQATAGLPPVTIAASTKLFKASECPEFTDPSRYWTWRGQFRRFCRANEVSPSMVPTAVERVAQRFAGDTLSRYAQHKDFSEFTRPTWPEAWNALLNWTDKTFLPANFYSTAQVKWRKVRASPRTGAQDFIVNFEAALWELNEAADTRGAERPNNAEVTRQFIAALPAHVRQEYNKIVTDMDILAYDSARDRLSIIWENTPWPASAKPAPSAKTPSAAPANATPRSPRQRACGNNTALDTHPVVAQDLRGNLYYKDGDDASRNAIAEARNRLVRQKGLCESCRRPRSAHPDPTKFRDVKEFRRPAAGARNAPKAIEPAPSNDQDVD